jgi:serine/threonine protein kinase
MSDVSRVEELFLNAASRQDPAERATYLAEHCGPDVDLRRRVEVLLAAQPHAEGFLEPPTMDNTRDYHPTPDAQAIGTVVAGKYRLLEVIGEGGMGTIWRAKQTEPVKRFVALKLIKPGMDSKQVLARFDAERQALAMMEHPNIAKILDGGIHDHRPFFVMELVKGTPINEFCDVRKLTPQQRLELFVPVCQAIQHAHMKGIIHRDIKPSNVLRIAPEITSPFHVG